MSFTDIVILIPSHSLEDFPTEHTDQPAASLLNAFSVAWHPALIASAGTLPRWRRADEPSAVHSGQILFVPTVCDDWLPHGWVEDARRAGATVIAQVSERAELEAMVQAALGDQPRVDPEWVADFYAFGFCWLQVELLSRHMRNFSNIEEGILHDCVLSAARAAVAGDSHTTQPQLKAAFELLLEARERFYPVECYLIDLCLAFGELEPSALIRELDQQVPINLLASATDMATLVGQNPAVETALRSAVSSRRHCLIGGEDRETLLPVLPLESVLHQFQAGRTHWKSLAGSSPDVWGRRRFGLCALLPQLLSRLGFRAALHIALDDGIYPDQEHTKLRWRGADESQIDALSRIPLAADGASSYLRFPVRLAESMDHDQVAGLIFARWPDVTSPWFHDLRRSQKYAPVLGRFVTLSQFFTATELPGQLNTYKSHEYFPPYLIQSVARRDPDPLSSLADHTLRRRAFDRARWCQALARALLGQAPEVSETSLQEIQLEAAAPEGLPDSVAGARAAVTALEEAAASTLAPLIMHGSPQSERGFLLINTLSFDRRVCVTVPGLTRVPPLQGPVKAAAVHSGRGELVVELPGAGYVWIPETSPGAPGTQPRTAPLDEGVLKTEWFEVVINPQTGGIGHIRLHNQRTKRLSQQVSFRFPRERTVGTGESAYQTQYAEMRCRSLQFSSPTPLTAEAEARGEILDPASGAPLATFLQRTRIWRARPIVEIDIELSDVKVPDGDPWNNYFASRFAWISETAAVTRSLFHMAQGFGGERFETSDYIEVADDEERAVIIPHGLPYHRYTGRRMVDSLLIVAGETRRRFQFTIAIDAKYPLEAAWNAMTPPVVVPTTQGPPRAGTSGWFFHLDARNVQLTRILNLGDVDSPSLPTGDMDAMPLPVGPGFAVRLLETEGRARLVRLRTFRQPIYARKRDFQGQTLGELVLDGDAVLVEMAPHEVVDVELRFGQS